MSRQRNALFPSYVAFFLSFFLMGDLGSALAQASDTDACPSKTWRQDILPKAREDGTFTTGDPLKAIRCFPQIYRENETNLCQLVELSEFVLNLVANPTPPDEIDPNCNEIKSIGLRILNSCKKDPAEISRLNAKLCQTAHPSIGWRPKLLYSLGGIALITGVGLLIGVIPAQLVDSDAVRYPGARCSHDGISTPCFDSGLSVSFSISGSALTLAGIGLIVGGSRIK